MRRTSRRRSPKKALFVRFWTSFFAYSLRSTKPSLAHQHMSCRPLLKLVVCDLRCHARIPARWICLVAAESVRTRQRGYPSSSQCPLTGGKADIVRKRPPSQRWPRNRRARSFLTQHCYRPRPGTDSHSVTKSEFWRFTIRAQGCCAHASTDVHLSGGIGWEVRSRGRSRWHDSSLRGWISQTGAG
jgi:hypothetical protein